MKIPLPLLFLCAAGTGFLFSEVLKPASSEVSGETNAAGELSRSHPVRRTAVSGVLTDFLKLKAPDDDGLSHARMVEALERMTVDEVTALARECARNPLPAGEAGALIWRRWALLDVRAAADFLGEVPPGEILEVAVEAVMARLAIEDPERAVRLHRELDPESRDGAVKVFLTKLAEVRPAEAVRRLEEFAFIDREGAGYAAAGIAEKYAESNPGEAVNWALSLTEEAGRAGAVARAVRVICLGGPDKAVALLSSLPPERQRELTLPLAETWAGRDPAAALAWVKSLTEAKGRANAWVGWIREKPDKAAERLTEIPDVSEREATRYRLLAGDDRSHFVDDATAVKLLREAAPGVDVDRQTQKTITYRISGAYPETLLEWAAGLPGDDVAGRAAAAALNVMVRRKQTAEAVAFVAAVTDLDRRRLLQNQLAEQWADDGRAAAEEEWLNTLPPDDRREATERMAGPARERKPEVRDPFAGTGDEPER